MARKVPFCSTQIRRRRLAWFRSEARMIGRWLARRWISIEDRQLVPDISRWFVGPSAAASLRTFVPGARGMDACCHRPTRVPCGSPKPDRSTSPKPCHDGIILMAPPRRATKPRCAPSFNGMGTDDTVHTVSGRCVRTSADRLQHSAWRILPAVDAVQFRDPPARTVS